MNNHQGGVGGVDSSELLGYTLGMTILGLSILTANMVGNAPGIQTQQSNKTKEREVSKIEYSTGLCTSSVKMDTSWPPTEK